MASAPTSQTSKNFNDQPQSQNLSKPEGLDKTLVLGTLASGLLCGIPAGLAFATGYLARKENVTSQWSALKSFVGKAIFPIVTSAQLKSLTNFGLISSRFNKLDQLEKEEDEACLKGASMPLDPACEEELKKKRTLVLQSLTSLSEAIHDRQSAMALATEILGITGSLYCSLQTWNAFKQGRKLQAAGWGLTGLASAFASGTSFLKNQILQRRPYYNYWSIKENNTLLDQAAKLTGLAASLFSAYKTTKALKDNKLLEAFQWFSLALCSGTLAYAASNLPTIT